MDSTHIHLMVNYLPATGTLIGGTGTLWGKTGNQNTLKTIAAAIVTAMAVIGIPLYLTGELAEERVEQLPGISEPEVEEHEEAAELVIFFMIAAGVTSLVAMVLQHKPSSKPAFTLATFLALLAFAAMARAGYCGGQIRHTELRTT